MVEDQLWYKNSVFYELYVRAYKDSNNDGHGDLKGVIEKLEYLQRLGADCIWLMPTYPSPLVDDGYDILDYYGIHPDYGNLDDFKKFIEEAHARGIRVMTDLVLNHTSDQHPWFQSARADKSSPFRDYYVWSDSDEKYSDARIIFVDTLDSNWTWDEKAGQYYWHRFFPEQPDLNYDNPAVQKEMENIISFWLDIGVDGFRADAVPYLFEREGTNCDNLQETHEYLKKLRRYIDENHPGRILLIEANQGQDEVLKYFGDGDEGHLAFYFPIMPRIFMALKSGDHKPLKEILEEIPSIPENTQWCTFLRNHDELSLEMVTDQEREWMWREYAPEPRMQSNLGIRRRLAPLLDNDPKKIKLANAILFSLPGSPILYYGDEIGMGDNIWMDDRDGVRTPMQWDAGEGAGFSLADQDKLYSGIIDSKDFCPAIVNVQDQETEEDSILNFTKKLIAIKNGNKLLSEGDLEWVDLGKGNENSAIYWRGVGNHKILVVNNLSKNDRSVSIPIPRDMSADAYELFSGKAFAITQNNTLELNLEGYDFLWFKIDQS